MRLTVVIRIPEVDDMMARAQEKVDAIRRAKEKTGELQPIDEVIFVQNIPQYNPEWENSPNGRATSYLATLVCRYMHELQQKDKKVVLSAKALETIYHMVSSSIGKLISGRKYLGGYALEQVRDKVEVKGKELPFRKKKKLLQQSTGLTRTSSSVMEHCKEKNAGYNKRISRTFSRIAVRHKKYQVWQWKFKENNCFGKQILRKFSKTVENVWKLR